MKLIHVHPEDLFDKERRGTLTPDERRHLDAHLDTCDVCRCERILRCDFEDDAASDDGEGSSLAGLVSGALDQGMRHPMSERGTSRTQADPFVDQTHRFGARLRGLGRISIGWRSALVAATLLLACGLAMARPDFARRTWQLVASTPRAAADHAPALPLPIAGVVSRKVQNSTATGAASAFPAAASVSENKIADEPAISTADPPAATHGLPHTSLNLPHRAPPTSAMGSSEGHSATISVATTETAAALFERANVARRQRHTTDASALYGELRSRYPSSAEARLALGLVARMELDRGHASAALADYNAYLATGSPGLREEALAGRALALGRLGQTEEERQTWSQLLTAYPQSSYARLASRRLAQDNP